MQLSDAGQQVTTRPSPNPTVAPGWFNNAPATLPPTIVDADVLNAIMAELLQFLSLSGQSASKLDVVQVATGALMLFGVYGLDSGGTANAYVVTPPTALPGLQDGQLVRMWTTRSNTAATTLQLAPLSAQPVTYANGAALIGGEIVAGLNELVWNQGLNSFVLIVSASRGAAPHGEAVLTASGNFTVPASVFQVYQQLQGAGGGGAGATTNQQGGAGGAGGYCEGWVAVTPGQVIAVTVGAGGAGSGPNATATAGGNSVAGSMTAHGGGGGTNGSSSCPGGIGAAATGGTLNVHGGDGTDGLVSTTLMADPGVGGASFFGGGGRNAYGSTGTDGEAYGSGGGAAYNSSPGTGGAGAGGVVIFKWR